MKKLTVIFFAFFVCMESAQSQPGPAADCRNARRVGEYEYVDSFNNRRVICVITEMECAFWYDPDCYVLERVTTCFYTSPPENTDCPLPDPFDCPLETRGR